MSAAGGPGDHDADLVGEQDADPELFRRRSGHPRSGGQDVPADVAPAAADGKQDLLVRRQPVTFHIEHPFADADPPVRPDHRPQVRRHRREPATVQAQQLGQLRPDDGDQVARLLRGDLLRGAEDTVEVAEPTAGPSLLPTAPQGQLGDGYADRMSKATASTSSALVTARVP